MQRTRIARALAPVFSAGAAGLAFALAPHAALAQGTPQAVEKIEVTGSNIKRVDAEGPAPVQVITRQEIERGGYSTVGDVMRFLPANSGLAYDETFTGSFAPGSAGVSLRRRTRARAATS